MLIVVDLFYGMLTFELFYAKISLTIMVWDER